MTRRAFLGVLAASGIPARHCCIKAKGVLTAPRSEKQGPQGRSRTVMNRAFKALPPGLYASRWTSSGKPIA